VICVNKSNVRGGVKWNCHFIHNMPCE